MKSTRNCNLCMERLVRLTLFAEGSGVFKAATKTSEMSHDLKHQKTAMNKNAIELVRHGTADGPYISVREITEICYL